MSHNKGERAQLGPRASGTTDSAEQEVERCRERSPGDTTSTSSSQDLWIFLLEVGVARRQASTYLALYRGLDWEDEFGEECLSIRQYLAGLTLTVHLTLVELGLPDPSIRLILACYGPEDTGDFLLNELHQAQTELFSRRSHLPCAD